ncbi:hypothetical protein CRE_14721 [Caenorhabditis remanei]|uniref:Uncharacterized protein n=1 Tax=Caenorhabditis remanei TaxID=31234 RepID=E3M9R6_CAERE|nr:hypothetical protein CRE_14721 [Caenorhabditis remanei]
MRNGRVQQTVDKKAMDRDESKDDQFDRRKLKTLESRYFIALNFDFPHHSYLCRNRIDSSIRGCSSL